MDKITRDFSNTLKRLRAEKNLTQEELAQRSGVDYKYLQKLEGQTPSSPTLSTLEKLANGLQISLVELIQSIQTQD
ncbi:MAG: helix-turn-helix transcriptional regulator [Deltaproteobacteria bacterium]|jgi:transcriptional regulator with XRE-family HTH domain|nr:helix-turn-helix transcriptional regulator [Deltaproteobacteria bacterium]